MNQRVIDALTEWWLRLRMTFAVIVACATTAACGIVPHPKLSTILVPCRTPAVARPDFPADHIVGQDIWSQVKGLLADRDVRRGYETQLESAVESCR